MDGSLAALFLAVGLTQMGVQHCGGDGCLARSDAEKAFSLSAGDVVFDDRTIGRETYMRYSFDRRFGPFQPAIGLSLTDQDTAWIGVGATVGATFWRDRGYVSLSLMPGVYARGEGPNLGHPVEFRSGLEFGYRAPSGVRLGLVFDHRSNGDIARVNPGLESVQLRVTVPLK